MAIKNHENKIEEDGGMSGLKMYTEDQVRVMKLTDKLDQIITSQTELMGLGMGQQLSIRQI